MAPRKAGAKKAPTASPKAMAVSHGYRSGLEDDLAKWLRSKGHQFTYEAFKIPFKQPETARTYTPDFALPNGIVVETKGRFLTADRQKHKWIKAQHPHLDLRFVFSNARAKLSKGSPTSYGDWCEKNGFLYADKLIPKEWLDEPFDHVRAAALAAIAIPSKKGQE